MQYDKKPDLVTGHRFGNWTVNIKRNNCARIRMPAYMNVCFAIYVIIFCLPRLYALSDKPAISLNFAKNSYITYKLATTSRTRQDYISLLFRTIKPSGLLLHAGDKHGDFITLELYRGRLR